METIEEDYVSFETAKLLKEKGFDESISMVYTSYGDLCKCNRYDSIRNSNYNDITKNYFEYTAPTLQMAMKWLRKNHQIFIRPNTSFLYPIKWYSEIFCYGDNLKTQQDVKTEYYNSPEEACQAAIKYCLENLIE